MVMPIQKKVEEAYTNLLQKYGNIITMRRKIIKLHIIFQEHLLIRMENMPGDNTIFTI